MSCNECGLPVLEYKQYIQIQSDICECCYITIHGADDQDLVDKDIQREIRLQQNIENVA